MTVNFAHILTARMRLSIYLVEEASTETSRRDLVQLRALEQCTIMIEHASKIRADGFLQSFQWFINQHMPIFVHILRLLQSIITDPIADCAWRAIEEFRKQGLKMPVDSQILKAWKVTKRSESLIAQDPAFIKDIIAWQEMHRQGEAVNGDSSGSISLSIDQSTNYMSLLEEMLNGSDFDFDMVQ